MLVKPDDLTVMQRKEFDKLGPTGKRVYLFVLNDRFTNSSRIALADSLPNTALETIDNSVSRAVLRLRGG